MPISLAYSPRELQRLDWLLVNHHKIRVIVELMDLSHNYIGDNALLTKRLLAGQVDVDADADQATRSCTLELLDPFHHLKLDGDAPEDGSLYFHRQVKITYVVIDPITNEQFLIPIFCGPITKVDRNGVVVTVTANGKEKLSLYRLWRAKTFKAGVKKSAAIRSLVVTVGGENKVSIPDYKEDLPRKLTVDDDDTIWGSAKRLASGMSGGKVLFYDGRGVATLRPRTEHTVFTFRTKGALLSEVSASFDAEGAINCVEIVGGKVGRGDKKRRIKYRIVAPRSHPLSPHKLGRWSKPRYMPLVISDDGIRSKAEAKRRAKKELNAALIEQVEVGFNSLPVPYLEENDLCRVVSDQYTGNFRLKKFSIPLTADGEMTVGYLERVSFGRAPKIKNKDKKKRRRNGRNRDRDRRRDRAA